MRLAAHLPRLRGGPSRDRGLDPLVQHRAPAPGARLPKPDGGADSTHPPGGLTWREHYTGFFARYLKNAEATEESWRGGWFHTGDVVRQMPDSMLVFLDRKKNNIQRSGETHAPH